MATERIEVPATPTSWFANKAVKAQAKERAKRRRRILLVVVLCLGVLWPMFAWVGAHLLIVKSDLPAADAIVVMSGSSTYLERADWAARLYREGRAPLVVLTNDSLIAGWDRKEERNPYFYELAARELQKRGVPESKIQVVSDIALGTYEESLGVRDYASAHQLKRLLVVTSAYHTRRTLWSLRHACEGSGIEIGIDSPPPGWQTPAPSRWWWRRWGWKVVAGEYVKLIYYWMRY
ncbi:MAG TPA: YdcF family protein [Pyrinomonadaceae bacterium]|nr:YdcF family protein [Pyrinomonadaceae bacterium]